MREIVLGTAGHVDHGKTSLIRALTGIETDRLKEEKKRGITIELGFAYLDLPCGHRLGIVDVPGHEKFVKNMVSGVMGMDLVAFIVAADEGIMPQTREHFEICRLLGVKEGIIVITKKDMVEAEWLDMVEEEVRDFCVGSFLEEAPLLRVSSTTGGGIAELKEELDRFVGRQELKEVYGPFRLPVDRVFAMKGFGAVITGTSISGRVAISEELRFYPSELIAKVRGLQVHSQSVEEVEAGHRTAINLQGVDTALIERGMVAATPGSLQPGFMLDCDFLYLAANEKPLKHRTRVRIHLGTAEVMGRISLLEQDELLPGDTVAVQLLFEESIAVWPGDRYVVRSYSPATTIGGGRVLGNQPARKRKRATEYDRQVNGKVFQILQHGTVEEQILLFLEESQTTGLTADELSIRIGLFGKQLKKVMTNPLSTRKIVVVDSASQRYLAKTVSDRVEETLLATLTAFHRDNPLQSGLSKEELRSGFGRRVEQKVFQFCLGELLKKELVVQEESVVRLTTHRVALQADEKALQHDLEEWYRQKGLATATIRESMEHFADAPESMVKEVLALLLRQGQLVKISESLYYHVDTINSLAQDLIAFINREGEIDAPRFKELTGLTRKFSIPLLEYFDKIKLTIRVGDTRVLRKKVS
ncbi:MAG: selenocysteine-specific translation elongation factor [Proteobacteria bacterium]|nr:selenocysteine-specific translation elongation factor [Desulfocapsa sp.]MBU3944121.1 selenocysteine-specific translation elongation factor [Pseudomonadota bacterium]MBU3983408.1 selenocysteine-specific translation elongation factor [Pseudomonadota bacterium]MBU4029738.1 selenocysteine-specific translation elongation factor [Pseudomonadota bacterium]MBU4043388.1 selenocysteine-specific translation elongation factor [Pseudomonadota bacterium]